MNWLILTIFLVFISYSACEQYTDRYDSINVDEILANRRLLVPYVKCVLEEGKCTNEGKELKKHITDAMQSSCAKCTDVQKTQARKVITHIKAKEPQYWEQMKSKYDPGDKYKPTYEKFLEGTN